MCRERESTKQECVFLECFSCEKKKNNVKQTSSRMDRVERQGADGWYDRPSSHKLHLIPAKYVTRKILLPPDVTLLASLFLLALLECC